jgi:CheY-like chemotaxis protein
VTPEQLDKRTRVLIIEDIETTRKMYLRTLELHGDFRVEAATDLAGALKAIERCAYQVAVVDIMLAGAKDTANRDGIEVLKRLRDLGEGTQAIVLSGQNETQLVREFLKTYEALDYLDKDELSASGMSRLVDLVEAGVAASPLGRDPSWDAVVAALASEGDEPMFVAEVIGKLAFKGGFENLRRNLSAATKHLAPLLPPAGGNGGLRYDEERHGFVGRFWSRGQGQAVELAMLDSQSSLDGEEIVYEREKGGLKILVSFLPDTPREDFAASGDA